VTGQEADALGKSIFEIRLPMMQGAVQRCPGRDVSLCRRGETSAKTHQPSGVWGGLRGIGSVAVILKQWYFQRPGWSTIVCHFLLTVSAKRSSRTESHFKTLNARSWERFPTMSKVDFAYFLRRRIWWGMSPGIQAENM